MSTSDCSSMCESGWTMYLDQSSNSPERFQQGDYKSKRANVVIQHKQGGDDEEEEEEDLSMVSDASSGPRQLHDDQEEEFYASRGYFGHYAFEQRSPTIKQNKLKEHYIRKPSQRNLSLDDTASSLSLTISKVDQASMDHVTTFKGKSTLKKHFGFLKHSAPEKAASDKSGLQGRKRQ